MLSFLFLSRKGSDSSIETGKVGGVPGHFRWVDEQPQSKSCVLLMLGLLAFGTWFTVYLEGYKSKNGRIALILAPIFTFILLFAVGSG